jgi:hypothetical protein
MENTKTRVCVDCGITHDITCFQIRKDSGKYRNQCHKCRSIKDKKTRQKRFLETGRCEASIPATIKCTKCNQIKSSEDFNWHIKSMLVKKPTCRECDKVWQRKYRLDNKEQYLLETARKRAKQKGIDFNITIEDIVIPDVCPVLGIRLHKDNDETLDTSPSLDRIDSSKGYIKGNICVISHRANTIKNYGDIEEHKKVIEYIQKNLPIDNGDYCI